VRDLVTGQRWSWAVRNYVRLDSFYEPVHILHVKEPS
jgi:starch synthase (maltosyl-transferring)